MTIYSLDVLLFLFGTNQSVVPCPVLTVASWPANRFFKRQVRWSGIPISFRIFHSLYLEKNMVQKDPCTPMFIATLFTIAKTWKQHKCPLKEEWIKMWYIYTMDYHSAIKKKKWNDVICSNMDGPRDCHTEWSKSEREGELSWHHLYVESKKEMIQMILFTKQTHKLREWTYGFQRGRICKG